MADQAIIEAALARVRAGNREAFRDVVHECMGVLRTYARFYISDPALADDALQEAFIEIYHGLDRYQPGTNFIAWAKAVTRSAVLTARNREGRLQKKHRVYRDAFNARVQEHLQAEERAHPVESQIAALHHCLKRLSERARTLVELHYFEHEDLATAGARLGLSANAAGVALHRARGALGQCIRKCRSEE